MTAAPADAQMEMPPYKGSAEFEQLKSLLGSWEMEMPPMKDDGAEAKHEDMPPMPKVTVEYRLTAGGSAIQDHDGWNGHGNDHHVPRSQRKPESDALLRGGQPAAPGPPGRRRDR